MAFNLLTAASGQQQATDEVTGPASYEQGGFSVRTSLGRADRSTAVTDSPDYEARVTGTGSQDTANYVTVSVFDQDGTGEVAADTDLSGVSFLIDSKRL